VQHQRRNRLVRLLLERDLRVHDPVGGPCAVSGDSSNFSCPVAYTISRSSLGVTVSTNYGVGAYRPA